MQVKEKTEQCEKLEEVTKSLAEKCKQLEQKSDEFRLSVFRHSGLDSSHTVTNISAEEKLNKFNPDIGQLKRIGELAERVSFN